MNALLNLYTFTSHDRAVVFTHCHYQTSVNVVTLALHRKLRISFFKIQKRVTKTIKRFIAFSFEKDFAKKVFYEIADDSANSM